MPADIVKLTPWRVIEVTDAGRRHFAPVHALENSHARTPAAHSADAVGDDAGDVGDRQRARLAERAVMSWQLGQHSPSMRTMRLPLSTRKSPSGELVPPRLTSIQRGDRAGHDDLAQPRARAASASPQAQLIHSRCGCRRRSSGATPGGCCYHH